jgi:dye decolorizing peroxidase
VTPPVRPTRRRLLGYVGATTAGAVAGAAAGAATARDESAARPEYAVTGASVSPFGVHQAGIEQVTPRSAKLLAFTLLPGTDRAALARLMRLWTADVVALTAGRAAPGDTAPDLAQGNVSLTVTVGLGPAVFELPGLASRRPAGLVEIPAMRHDRLEPRWSGGDLLLVVAADDATTVAHAARRLVSDAEPFARPRWTQTGSWRATDADGKAVTGRNLFGQVDGTGNPASELFTSTVWAGEPEWFRGGTTLVVRRIRMNLGTWDELTRSEQERAVGRRLDTGAPLTGKAESDELDLAAKDGDGRHVIPANAHARLSHHTQNAGRRIFRKGFNYTDEQVTAAGVRTESGLIFVSYQASIAEQFIPLQTRLDQGDALNEWTTAVGSAVFAVPPGYQPDTWVAQSLLA